MGQSVTPVRPLVPHDPDAPLACYEGSLGGAGKSPGPGRGRTGPADPSEVRRHPERDLTTGKDKLGTGNLEVEEWGIHSGRRRRRSAGMNHPDERRALVVELGKHKLHHRRVTLEPQLPSAAAVQSSVAVEAP